MGLDPALAVGLQAGEEAAAELAAIPDWEALRRADDMITRGEGGDRTGVRSSFEAKIEPMVARFCEGAEPNFANASVAELLAFCVAIERLAWG
jgi:hypothetical protein